MNRRLIVVTYHTPPGRAVGGLRWWGFSRHLARRGWQVLLVTRPRRPDAPPPPPGVEVQAVDRTVTLRDRYRAFRTSLLSRSDSGRVGKGSTGSTNRSGGNESPDQASVLGWSRANLAEVLSFPDEARGWILRSVAAIRRSVDEFGPDVVVSTGPPHSLHLATGIALGNTGARWIVDLRDPWSDLVHSRKRQGWGPALHRRLEASVFRRADHICATTQELAAGVLDQYPSRSVSWLPNGVDAETLPPRVSTRPRGLKITHLGTVYLRRDPRPVVAALAAFLDRHPAARGPDTVLQFVGSVTPDFATALRETVDRFGLQDHVQMVEPVDRERALEVLADSDAALVLAQGQEILVPAKLYEAVSMRLPTLVLTEVDSATGREGRRLGAWVHSPDDHEGMVQAMARIWSRDFTGRPSVPERVDHARLVGWVEAVFAQVLQDGAPRNGEDSRPG